MAAAVFATATVAWCSSVAAGEPDDARPARVREPLVEPWPRAIAVGGGVNGDGHVTGEVTFSPGIGGPLLSAGYANGGQGGRVYVEGGANLILNLAAGVGYHVDSTLGSRWGFHAFAGLPLPVIGWGRDGASTPFTMRVHVAPLLLYVEPFYRPEFRKGAGVENEVGVLMKLRIGLTKRQWSLPGYDMMADIVI